MRWLTKLLAVVIMSFGVSYAFGAGLALFTGPGGSNPINQPNLLADLNNLITKVNAQVTTYLAFNQAGETGEMALPTAGTWAPNGTTATSVTSVGPVGAHTTVQKWITVVDNTGAVYYVPAF